MKTLLILLAASSVGFAQEKPNIVLIYADDMGYGEVSCYNPDPGSGGWGTGGDHSQPVQLYNLDDDLGESKLCEHYPKH